MRIRFRAAVLLPVVACAAGASGVDRTTTFLSAAPPPDGRTCYAIGAPTTLPAVGALVDSTALIAGLKSLANGEAEYVLLSVRFDERGLPSARVIEGNVPPERREDVAHLALSALKPESPAAPWSVRLKVTSDSAPRVQVGRSELCPALATGTMDIVTSRRRGTSSTIPSSAGPRPSAPRFSVLVDTTGRLLDIKLKESSGSSDQDQQWEDNLRRQSFRPTLLDGVPTVAWTEWPPR